MIPPLTPQPPVTWLGMSRDHFDAGRPCPIRAIVLHATAGHAPGDLAWLRKGGDERRPVSCHYYIDTAGQVSQLVRDEDTAWHAGRSRWPIDGRVVEGLNHLSLGVELSNLNTGSDPYSAAQLDAAAELLRYLAAAYRVPRSQLVRHLDISPGRKTDPAGLPWAAFVARVYDAPPAGATTPDSPIIGPPSGTAEQALRYLAARSTQYHDGAVSEIVAAYRREGGDVGVDWFLALAQLAHETGGLSSWWCARPRRNPAGLGVTGQTRPGHVARPGPAWAHDGTVWREGLSFARWAPDAVRAHLGRLLAYALPPGARFGPQQAMADEALALRPLALALHGCAPTLRGLGGTWAFPGESYAERVAATANRMREGV